MPDGSLGYHPTRETPEAEIDGTATPGNGVLITVYILGPNVTRFEDIEVRSGAPMLTMARRLILAGYCPDTLVRFVWEATGVQSLKTTTLGALAPWTVRENDTTGPALVPYKPFPGVRGEARTAFQD